MNRLPPILLAVCLLPLSGCLGGGETNAGPDPSDTGTNGPGPSNDPGSDPGSEPGQTAGTSKPTSNVRVDPNANFTGGAHTHDWWGGENEIVILDRDIKTGPGGVCIGGPTGTNPNGCAQGEQFIRFPLSTDPSQRPSIVFPGTGKMTIEVRVGQLVHPFELGLVIPNKKPMYGTRLKVDAAQKTFVIDGINETNTDPPHFHQSSWMIGLFVANGGYPQSASAFQGPLHMTVKVHRDETRELPVDPPHPDFWNGQTQLTLVDQRVKTTGQKLPLVSSGGGGAPVLDENRTIMTGTGKLVVTMGWTNNDPSAPLSKLKLTFCPGNNYCGEAGGITMSPAPTQDQATRRVYEIEVRPDWWDSPYSSKSKWIFGWGHEDVAGGDNGKFDGTIDWNLEIFKMT